MIKLHKTFWAHLFITLLLALVMSVGSNIKPTKAAWAGSSFKLTVSVSPAGGGTVEIDNQSYTTFPVSITIDSGKTVSVLSIPSTGYIFSGWSGDITDSVNPTEIEMTCPKSITANFSPIMYNLEIKINGKGSTSPSLGIHSYAAGEIVTIVATPDDGWRFSHWTGDVSDKKAATTNINIDTPKSVTANFAKKSSVWLIPLIIGIIGALVLIGIGGRYYYITHKKSQAAEIETISGKRQTAKSRQQNIKLKRAQQVKGIKKAQPWIQHKKLMVTLAVITAVSFGFSLVPFLGGDTSSPDTNNSNLPEIERISVEGLKAKLDKGSNIAIVDTQPESYYRTSHITGAISIPFTKMTAPYNMLNGYDEIVIYCNWPDEEDSARAAQTLMDAGFPNVKVLDGGIGAWIDAGFPIQGNNSFLPEVNRISAIDLKAKIDQSSNIIIIDSEYASYYQANHIVGAISMPLETMAAPYIVLDGYEEIITYCNWPDEEFSARAAQILMEAGYTNVKALDGGISAWVAAGLPIESAPSEK